MMRQFLLIHVLAVLTALTCSGNCKAGIVISIDHAMAHAGDTILLGVYASSSFRSGEALVGRSPAMLELFKTIGRVAASDAAVLILGSHD